MNCSACEANLDWLDDEAVYCPYCGDELDEAAAQEPEDDRTPIEDGGPWSRGGAYG